MAVTLKKLAGLRCLGKQSLLIVRIIVSFYMTWTKCRYSDTKTRVTLFSDIHQHVHRVRCKSFTSLKKLLHVSASRYHLHGVTNIKGHKHQNIDFAGAVGPCFIWALKVLSETKVEQN